MVPLNVIYMFLTKKTYDSSITAKFDKLGYNKAILDKIVEESNYRSKVRIVRIVPRRKLN